jgi:glycosyltransferase involved in cell wall biosynthesis
MNPIISIIIPCYNHGKYIQETLDSIESAKDKYDVEVIIVNDGSTDEYTIVKLKELENLGYLVLNQKNCGLAKARNNGIELAKGKYILPLDSDNKVLKPYLNEAIDVLEKNVYLDIVYGNAIYFGEKTGDWIVEEYSLFKLVSGNYIDSCAVYRKSVWKKIGGYDEQMPAMGVEDWDFWLNSSFKGFRFYHLNSYSFKYRVLSNSMINSLLPNSRKLLAVYIEEKYKEYTDVPTLENYYTKKLFNDINCVKNNLSVKSIIKVFILKIISRIKKSIHL